MSAGERRREKERERWREERKGEASAHEVFEDARVLVGAVAVTCTHPRQPRWHLPSAHTHPRASVQEPRREMHWRVDQ
eukprot:888545-Rhodomonas_salina.1